LTATRWRLPPRSSGTRRTLRHSNSQRVARATRNARRNRDSRAESVTADRASCVPTCNDPPLSRRVPRWRRACVRPARQRPLASGRRRLDPDRLSTVEERNPLAWLSRSGIFPSPLFLDVHPLGIGVSTIMATCGEYIRSQFPTIDDDLYRYVQGKYSRVAE